MKPFSFTVLAKDKKSRARVGIITIAHGKIETPYLVPVATRGFIIALTEKDISKLKVQCMLANTYHLHFKVGSKKIKKAGGLHKWMKFSKPLFTDSGGFQAFSLGIGRETNAKKIGFVPENRIPDKKKKESFAKITSQGVLFKSIYDGKKYFMDAKKSMKIQSDLGSDIIMAFDECTSAFHDKNYIKSSMERSHRWELESLKFHNKKQALYGIIHGGWFKELRIKSARFVNSQNFDGIAIGGSLGKEKTNMYKILDWVVPELDERPRHMLGIGHVEDIFECVERGIDTFDCVEMTRLARHGSVYISPKSGGSKKNKFKIDLGKGKFADDKKRIDKNCECSTCKKYSRAELRKLHKSQDFEKRKIYGKLATIHNIYFMENLTRKIREAIRKGRFKEMKREWLF